MVVGDHDLRCFAPVEIEDDAELVVDADAELAAQRTLELLEVVAGAGQVEVDRRQGGGESVMAAAALGARAASR